MTSATLLVVAASSYQLRAIQTAKRLGYRVITTDNVPGNPGHALADRAYSTDTTDTTDTTDLEREPWVEFISMDCDRGAPIKAFTNGRHRVGEALVRGTDRASLDEHVRELRRRLDVRAVDAVAS